MSTASDSFKQMFFGTFNRERVVEIPDVSPDGFRAMLRQDKWPVLSLCCPLRYVYTNEADITDDNVESLMKVSDKYLLTGLLAECAEWLKKNVTSANACRFLPLGELYTDIGEV